MTSKQKKVVKWILTITGVALLLFIIIFTPCFTELIFTGSNELFALDVVLMVLLPFSTAINCFLGAYILREFTTERMLELLEVGFKKGTMDLETYKTAYRNITLFKVFQKQASEEAKIEAELIKNEAENKKKEVADKISNERYIVLKPQQDVQQPNLDEPEEYIEEEDIYEEEQTQPIREQQTKRTPLF